MATRTYLTTPAGDTPDLAASRTTMQPRERYVPGLRRPYEPEVASRSRAVVLVVALLLAVAGGAVATFRLSAATQAQDPSLVDPDATDTGSGDEGPTLRDGPGGIPGDG